MKCENHLFVKEAVVAPATEWTLARPCWRFLHISQGQGYWIGNPATRALEAGDVVILAPAAEGLVRASQLTEMVVHYFQFCPELLTGLLTLAERQYLESAGSRIRSPLRFLPASHLVAQQFKALCASGRQQNTLHQRGQMLGLIGEVFAEEAAPPPRKRTPIASARQRFHELIRQMPEAEVIKHTPDELARQCGCSLRHFSRLFHEQLGISVRAQQTKLRLEKASQLLRDTDAKIVQVANESGYRHLSLFNSMFKRHFGVTPSQYRQEHHASSAVEEQDDSHKQARTSSAKT